MTERTSAMKLPTDTAGQFSRNEGKEREVSGEKGVWVARKGAERKASAAGMKGVGWGGGVQGTTAAAYACTCTQFSAVQLVFLKRDSRA